MISELKIRNFKSLESVDLKLGHFNLLVGANASGKSNFLDALRFLQGVGNGFTISEILDGKPPTATSFKWDGIRGGSKAAAFRQMDGSPANIIEFEVMIPETNLYGIRRTNLGCKPSFFPGTDRFERFFFDEDQRFWHDNEQQRAYLEGQLSEGLHASFFNTAESYTNALKQKYPDLSPAEAESRNNITPATFHLDEYSIFVAHVLDALSDMQFLDPNPAVLRAYSSKIARLWENCKGFAALIREIENSGSKPALLEWLEELRPDEVEDIYALEGLNNDFMVAIKEGNKGIPRPSPFGRHPPLHRSGRGLLSPSMPRSLLLKKSRKVCTLAVFDSCSN